MLRLGDEVSCPASLFSSKERFIAVVQTLLLGSAPYSAECVKGLFSEVDMDRRAPPGVLCKRREILHFAGGLPGIMGRPRQGAVTPVYRFGYDAGYPAKLAPCLEATSGRFFWALPQRVQA